MQPSYGEVRKALDELFEKYPYEHTEFSTKESYREWIHSLLLKKGIKCNIHYVRKIHCFYQNNQLVTTRVVTYPSGKQLTTESLRSKETVDTEGMKVKQVTTNPYGNQWVRYVNEEVNEAELFEEIYDKLGSPKLDSITPHTINGDCAAVINMYDAHLDKIAVQSLHGTTGKLSENIDRFERGVNKSLSICKSHNVDLIIFPIGHDLFHTNGMDSKTKKGTPIQYLCHPLEAYTAISTVIIRTIQTALTVAPVWIPYIPGNHDRDKVSVLGFWMDKLFEANDHYSSDSNVLQRAYKTYGDWFLAFSHGDKFKHKINEAPLVVSQENPVEWGRAKGRKIYLGDQHHQFEYKFLKSKDYPGTSVEFLRSVGLDDEYHAINGWVGVPHTVYVDIYSNKSTETFRHTFDM